jgi:hypothetical protein
VTLLEALRDAHARVTRALDALQVGELDLAELLLDDLAADVWSLIKREETPR